MPNDEANHRFAFLSVPGLEDDPDKVKHNVMHHCAFEYESFSDLMSSYARMRDEGAMLTSIASTSENPRGANGLRFLASRLPRHSAPSAPSHIVRQRSTDRCCRRSAA
jgi:hypothetical protein